MVFNSNVKGYEGKCKPTWINKNQFCHRVDGGVTGFFKNVKKIWWFWIKVGKEFHGIVKANREIYSTEGKYIY